MLPHFTSEEIALFWSKVQQGEPDACWPWTGTINTDGHGIFASTTAHRVAFYLSHGQDELPLFSVICHSCDNRPCCNSAHLWIGTQRDNIHDMMRKGRHGTSKRPWTDRK